MVSSFRPDETSYIGFKTQKVFSSDKLCLSLHGNIFNFRHPENIPNITTDSGNRDKKLTEIIRDSQSLENYSA